MANLSKRQLLAAAALAAVAGGVGYGAARWLAPPAPPAKAPPERRILYWYDPMVPLERYAQPGLSSMGMQTIPKYADDQSPSDAGIAPGVKVDGTAAQALGVRLATASRGTLATGQTVVGTVAFNQRDITIVQSRTAGFVERVHGRAPGDIIGAGAALADVLVPEWAGAQSEYLAVLRTGDTALAAAARQRLRLLGMGEATIAAVEHSGAPRAVITITAPAGGVITGLDVRQGMTLAPGQTLAQIGGITTVWLDAAVPEASVGDVRVGQAASARFVAFPGERFTGRITALLPTAQTDSRTITARIALVNRGLRLRPGMFASVDLAGSPRSALLIPSEAVIRTGRRVLAMRADAAGRYRPVEVRIGREGGGMTEVYAGLGAGDRVVASGQFLIDSEASLAGLAARPLAAAALTPAEQRK